MDLNQLNHSLGQLNEFMATFKALSDSPPPPNPISLLLPPEVNKIPEQSLDLKIISNKNQNIAVVLQKIMEKINTNIIPIINTLVQTMQEVIDNLNKTASCLNNHVEDSFNEFSGLKQQFNKNKEYQIYLENRKKLTIKGIPPAELKNTKSFLLNTFPESRGLRFNLHTYLNKKNSPCGTLTFDTVSQKREYMDIVRKPTTPAHGLSFSEFIPKHKKLAEGLANTIGYLLKRKLNLIRSYNIKLSPSGVTFRYSTTMGDKTTWHNLNIDSNGSFIEEDIAHLFTSLNLTQQNIIFLQNELLNSKAKYMPIQWSNNKENPSRGNTNKRNLSATATPVKNNSKRILIQDFNTSTASTPTPNSQQMASIPASSPSTSSPQAPPMDT